MKAGKRDLRTGTPVWAADPAPEIATEPLAGDARCDVLVIGAGVSGALVGEMLAADGHDVLILDRRGPAKGSTAATTALVQYEIDEPLTALADKIGERRAVRAWRRSHLALQGLVDRTCELGIDCAVQRRASLYLAGNRLNAKGIRREAEARRAAGLETTFLDRAALKERFGITRPAALLGFANAAIEPVQLTLGYLQAALASGARLHAPVEARHVALLASGLEVATADGPKVRCKHVVFATGYELHPAVPPNGHRVISTYAIATKPQKRRLWPEECFVWEASDPYLYLRSTADGRVICGGEDEDFSDEGKRDALLPKKVEAIRRKLGRLLPELDTEAAFAWTGSFGASETGLPTVGPVPGMPGCWAVMGYGGNGITYSRIAAELIRTALGGGEDPDLDLYAFREG